MEKPQEQILLDQEENELDIEVQELQIESLDFWTLSFLREHIDMPERIDFSPDEELQQIKKAVAESPEEDQSNQRMLLMASFRRRLKILRENMAQAQLELEIFIRENPETNIKELSQTVEEIAGQNNISAQKRYLLDAARSYLKAHTDIINTIQTYKGRYPDSWQAELFRDLFKQPPRGQIEIEAMPMNIYIKIGNIEDYVIANGAPENIARSSGGAFLNGKFPKVKALSGKILIENVSLNNPKYSEKVIKPHEEEHSIHRNIYPRSAFIKGENDWLRDLGYNREIELPLFNAVLNKSITNIFLGYWLYEAKTEILAYMKTGINIDRIKQVLIDPNGLYNYLDKGREHHQNWFIGHLKASEITANGSDNHRLTEEEIKAMYSSSLEDAWHKRYLPMLEETFQILEKILAHYGSDKYPEIIRLLSQEPINKWPRLAKILS